MQIYYITRCICVCSACVSLNSFLIPGCTNIRRKVYKCQKIKKASETRSDTLRDFLLWNIIQRKNLISEMLRASLPLCPRVKLHSRCCTESNGHAMRATREFFYLLRFDSVSWWGTHRSFSATRLDRRHESAGSDARCIISTVSYKDS